MLIVHDVDRYVSVQSHSTCAFHKANPGVSYAGCGCSSYYGMREATPSEYEENKRKRLEREEQTRKFFADIQLIKD